MENNGKKRQEVLFAGLGGRGVLLIGQVLAAAGMSRYRHVVWFPLYGASQRGGFSHCTVVLSDEAIASPYLAKIQDLVVLEASELGPLEDMVRPGGLILTEEAGLKGEPGRQDVRLVKMSAIKEALKLGSSQASNFILLGAYVSLTGVLPPELVERELENRFAASPDLLGINRKAFGRGIELGSSTKTG